MNYYRNLEIFKEASLHEPSVYLTYLLWADAEPGSGRAKDAARTFDQRGLRVGEVVVSFRGGKQ